MNYDIEETTKGYCITLETNGVKFEVYADKQADLDSDKDAITQYDMEIYFKTDWTDEESLNPYKGQPIYFLMGEDFIHIKDMYAYFDYLVNGHSENLKKLSKGTAK
jgi:hypothetical protein